MRKLFFLLGVLLSLHSIKGQEMKLMTYNIKYANENDGKNSWSKRKEWITNQIKFYEPDILGVQEAVKLQLDHFAGQMENYRVLGVGREGENKGEFSAILFNTKKFENLDTGTFWLSETPAKISKGWDAALPRICTYGLFRDRLTGKKFYVFNTHFDHVGEKARLQSSKLIIDKIKDLNRDGLPVFLMGDFNLEPNTAGIKALSAFLEKSREKAKLSFGPVGTFNGYNFKKPVTRRIDYIFTNKKVKINKYAVLSDSKDLKYPSDHFPVLVVADLGN